MPIARSAAGPTVVLTEAMLLAGGGANSWGPAVAMAVIIPSAVGVTVIVAVADAPAARLVWVTPRLVAVTLQMITLPIVLIVPWETVVDWIWVLNGKALVTVTEEARLGALFVNETV